ncbi:type I pantothenate kinase [Periweissella fabaria]|uniref:Pantothenate kinase n=1 Tax=Periweissella fabaria TaxID=546157 RepID=A0ABN8BJZ1_9LACO|nr:type I pantothenate kinase [Periweissella fabaria]MCM0597637.1 type I pantothenate kinase [Periweissella fabaria]CAH0416821.1 Pantothenate kinase [Periweissella fabaria]
MANVNYNVLNAAAWRAIGVEFAPLHDWQLPMTATLQADYQALVPLVITKMQHNHAAEMMWQDILGQPTGKVKPFVIGLTGSVAVGKSTIAKTIKQLLAEALPEAKIEIVTTDNFLYNNQILASLNLTDRKGFPESYNIEAMITFLKAVKERHPDISVPVYSHEYYDVLPNQVQLIDEPDIVILEGVNALHRHGQALAPIDLMDLTIYIDAPTALIKNWFMQRFERLIDAAEHEPTSYYHKFISNRSAATKLAAEVWQTVNERNLKECILPARSLADIIIEKGTNHSVTQVALRKY